MIVKKKIIQQPYDLEAEKLYYKELLLVLIAELRAKRHIMRLLNFLQ